MSTKKLLIASLILDQQETDTTDPVDNFAIVGLLTSVTIAFRGNNNKLTLKPITNTGFCQDIFWIGRIFFDFTAQSGHEDTQMVGAVHVAIPPDLFQDLTMRQHTSHVGHQQCQNPILKGCQMDGLSVEGDEMLIDIHQEITKLENALLLLRCIALAGLPLKPGQIIRGFRGNYSP